MQAPLPELERRLPDGFVCLEELDVVIVIHARCGQESVYTVRGCHVARIAYDAREHATSCRGRLVPA